jgi:hypothetical protein
MKIKAATRRGFHLPEGDMGYGTNREESLDRRHGLPDLDPDAFLTLERGYTKRKPRPVSLAPVSILKGRQEP